MAILTMEKQAEAYTLGHSEGVLARSGYVQVSLYLLNAVSDFGLGSWSQQHTQGYFDGYMGLSKRFIAHK